MDLARDLAYAADIVAFAAGCGYPDLDPWQRHLLTSTAPRVAVVASRQSGKSSMLAVLAAHELLYRPGSLTVIAAPGLRQSVETFKKLTACLDALGRPVDAESESMMAITLATGSRCVAIPGSNDALVRGYSAVSLLLFEEAAFVSNDLYYAMRPVLAVSGGRLVAGGSPFGKRGWLWQVWSDHAQDSEPWERLHVPATKCPRISPAFLAAEQRSMGAFRYASEYLAEFWDADSSALRSEDIDAALRDYAVWDFDRFLPTAMPTKSPDGGPPTPDTGTAWNFARPAASWGAEPQRRELTPQEAAEQHARQFEAEVRRMWRP